MQTGVRGRKRENPTKQLESSRKKGRLRLNYTNKSVVLREIVGKQAQLSGVK
jgi:hypothetical protein